MKGTIKMLNTRCGKQNEKGIEILEFALVVAFILVPLLLGVVVIGINLGRAVQVAQVARDGGSMYVRGIDFSQSGNQAVLARLGQGLGLAASGGVGVVILSKVTHIPIGGCTNPCNEGQYVMTQRIVIGDSALVTAHGQFQSNGLVTLDAQGNVVNYIVDPNAIVSNFNSVLTLTGSEFAFISEAYFPTPDVNMPGYSVGNGVYSRSIY
jgi:hypothetical protein